MVNKHRGEVEARLDGKMFRLVLTLGALAELENAFGDDDMVALAERFGSGRIKAQDAIGIIGAGLRGAGHDIDNEQVGQMETNGGAAGFIAIVAELLIATFGQSSGTDATVGTSLTERDELSGVAVTTSPFPGAT